MVVDAPFIYRASDPVDLTENVAHLQMETKAINLDPVVLPPPVASVKNAKTANPPATASNQPSAQEKHGFFAKVSAFFASIFH